MRLKASTRNARASPGATGCQIGSFLRRAAHLADDRVEKLHARQRVSAPVVG
jgi:hypothetical protein